MLFSALARFPRWRAIDATLHRLWTRAVGQPGYLRREWEELSESIQRLATEGLGPPDPAAGGGTPPAGEDPTVPNGQSIH